MDTLDKLMEKGQQVKQVRENLVDALDEAESHFEKILEENKLDDRQTLSKFDYKGFGFRRIGSQHGQFIHLTKLGTKSVIKYGCPPLNRGDDFFYHSDFNASCRVMTRKETLELANILKEFSENMLQVMNELKEEESKEIEY